MRLAEVVREVEGPHEDAVLSEVHHEAEGVSETVDEVEAAVDRSQVAEEDRVEALAREGAASEHEDEKQPLVTCPAFNGVGPPKERKEICALNGFWRRC